MFFFSTFKYIHDVKSNVYVFNWCDIWQPIACQLTCSKLEPNNKHCWMMSDEWWHILIPQHRSTLYLFESVTDMSVQQKPHETMKFREQIRFYRNHIWIDSFELGAVCIFSGKRLPIHAESSSTIFVERFNQFVLTYHLISIQNSSS